MKKAKYRTDILFPRTNFLMGAGSIFNIAGKYFEFNDSKTEEMAECLATENDWGLVGQDLMDVILKNPIEKHK